MTANLQLDPCKISFVTAQPIVTNWDPYAEPIELTHEQLAEVYNTAADYIEEHGWTQRQGEAADGSVCAQMAVGYGTAKMLGIKVGPHMRMDSPEKLARLQMAGRIADHFLIQKLGTSIPHWNDVPERTVEQVLDFLRAMAKAQMMLANHG